MNFCFFSDLTCCYFQIFTFVLPLFFCPECCLLIRSAAYIQVQLSLEFSMEANSMNPDQTAPSTVWSSLIWVHIVFYNMHGSRKFCQRGSNFDNFFFFSLMRGGRIQIPLLAGHQRSASKTPFKWRFTSGPDDGPTLNARLVAL